MNAFGGSMRPVHLTLPALPALAACLVAFACSRSPLEEFPLQCFEGEVACNGSCVPAGACTASTPPAPKKCKDVASFGKTMTTQYDGAVIPVTGSDKQYYVQTNWWSLWQGQTVAVDGLSLKLGNPNGAASSDNNPMGYPSFYIGSYAGHATRGSNLPKQVSALTKIPTFFSSNAGSKGVSNYNASYDVWFTANGTPLSDGQYFPGPGGAYLMVWLFMPSDRQPRGTSPYRGQKVAGLPGTWDVWIDYSTPPCISYVSSTPLETLEFDLNDVIKDATKNNYGITNSMYLSIVFGGFEVWGGGDGLELRAFCADVE
jgi:hypothetical protein